MILFAYGVASLGDVRQAGWLHGLKLAAVAVVARAVWGMGSKLCPDWPRRVLAIAAASAVLLLPGAPCQIGAIAACALIGVWIRRKESPAPQSESAGPGRRPLRAAGLLSVLVLLLVLLPVLARQTGDRSVAVFDGFYRSGALVFGGGHVVLPLLRVRGGRVSRMDQPIARSLLALAERPRCSRAPCSPLPAYLGTVIHVGFPCLDVEDSSRCVRSSCRDGFWSPGPIPSVTSFAQRAGFSPHSAVPTRRSSESCSRLSTGRWAPRGSGTPDVDAVAALVAIVLLGKFLWMPPWAVVGLAAAAGEWILK